MIHVAHINASWHTYQWSIPRVGMCDVERYTYAYTYTYTYIHICIHIHIHIHTHMHTHTHTHTYTYAYTYTYTHIHTTCRNVWRWALHICMLYGVHMSAWCYLHEWVVSRRMTADISMCHVAPMLQCCIYTCKPIFMCNILNEWWDKWCCPRSLRTCPCVTWLI